MALLTKIKGSTLMETLVASVLIVVVFMISSMILNNLFSNAMTSNTGQIEARLNELEYFHQSDKLVLPYSETYNDWNIVIDIFKEDTQFKIEFEATKNPSKQQITRLSIEN